MTLDLSDARRTAEKTLTDQGVITRAGTGTAVLDRVTGQLSRPPDVPVWAGPASVTDLGAGGLSTVGLEDHELQSYVARVPVSCTAAKPGDLFWLTAIGDDGDTGLIGRGFTVTEVSGRSTMVLRRLVLSAVIAEPAAQR